MMRNQSTIATPKSSALLSKGPPPKQDSHGLVTPEATLFSKEQIYLLQKLLRQPQPSPVPPVLGTGAVE
ncbi:hypothetical protein CK203_045990 [Vitis vinifera]|uniref:Uncharacterized protein n=1 Tax=Vitis vinifera TaxID=29760 RepID=A0A438HH31_VITVI|nr:hypothetical protein CK203_045990 [Vitis vinifera]